MRKVFYMLRKKKNLITLFIYILNDDGEKNKIMSRNNEANIKKHNDKLHKAQDKAKQQTADRKEKLKQIALKYKQKSDETP